MQLHLFSTPGEPLLQDIVQACRPLLVTQPNPLVVYLPVAAIGNLWIEFTIAAFKDLAVVRTVDIDQTAQPEIESLLDLASLLYVPGGNTYWLKHRLQQHGLMESLQRRLRHGLPLAAFSAGTVLCGHNILTTNDMNVCEATNFTGLALTPFNFHVHYPAQEGPERKVRDDRIWEYHAFHHHPVLALEDGAYLRMSKGQMELVKGNCWRFEPGQERTQVDIGVSIQVA